MPRRPRVLLAGYPLHIVQRGINREPYFFADEDYQGRRLMGCGGRLSSKVARYIALNPSQSA